MRVAALILLPLDLRITHPGEENYTATSPTTLAATLQNFKDVS